MSDSPAPDDASAAAEDRIARNRARRAAASEDADVPKLPRGRGFKLSRGQLIRIALTGAMLVMLVVVQRPCAESVSSFVTGFGGDPGSAAAKMPKPGNVDVGSGSQHYEMLHPGMTEDEIKAVMERARAANNAAKP